MKTYVKPELFFESFELAQHIAGCDLTLNSQEVQACTASGTIYDVTLDGTSESWFLSKNAACTAAVEVYCYTNGTMGLTTINS